MNNINFQGLNGFQWFFGVIEDVNDPLQIGRVRVRPFGIYGDEISTSDIPWAIQIQSISSASDKGIGISPTGLEKESVVFGFFVDNDLQQPIILGSYFGKNDMNPLAIGTNTITRSKIGPEPSSSYGATYPDNKVTMTKSGHVFELDDSKGNERIHIYHKSGSYQEYQPGGIVIDKSIDDKYIISSKALFVHAESSITSSSADHNITTSNKLSLTNTDTEINSSGKINANGSTVTINANGSVTINASLIYLKGNVSVSGGAFTWNGKIVKTI